MQVKAIVFDLDGTLLDTLDDLWLSVNYTMDKFGFPHRDRREVRGFLGNGVPGDLLILVEEEQDPNLIRDENDLIYNLLLSFPTAALGGAVEIPTIDGKVKVKIDSGTQPGKVLRLRGKGLPNVNGYGTGDLLVNVSVYVPETLNKDEKKALEEMEESDNFKPNTSIKEKIFKKFKSLFD